MILKCGNETTFVLQDKHNLYDENLKPKTPGVIEVSREEFFKVNIWTFFAIEQSENYQQIVIIDWMGFFFISINSECSTPQNPQRS